MYPYRRKPVTLLEQISTLTGEFDLVFTGDTNPSIPMSENTVNRALRKMGYDTKTEICGHGFHSMACSALIESGLWSETAIERQISHKERNKRPSGLYPQSGVHRRAEADHELVEPIS